MKKLFQIIALLLIFNCSNLFAQSVSEEEQVKNTINSLFDGMRTSDSTLLRKAFGDKCILQTIVKTKDGKSIVKSEDINLFISLVAKPHSAMYDERITFTKILIDDNLASVWTDYKFYVGDKFSHCGVNSFQLFKTAQGWKIIYLIDTRRKENCNG